MHQITDKHHATPAQVAMAWVISKGTTPIIGVTRKEQVEDALQAMKLKLREILGKDQWHSPITDEMEDLK